MSFFLEDLRAALDRDPAATSAVEVFLTYSGFHAICWFRIAHRLYHWGVPLFPKLISHAVRLSTGIEIHPAAEIGRGFFIDHGAGVVIGETSIIGNDVTLFQGVTLGGTGKERGKRHPTLGDRVVVGAGAKILGDITIGDDVYVGANAVVLRDVPDNSTVVGIPGRIARREGRRVPSVTLDHIHLPDPIARDLESLHREIRRIEDYLKKWEGGPQVSFLAEEERETGPGSESSSEISQAAKDIQNGQSSAGGERTEGEQRAKGADHTEVEEHTEETEHVEGKERIEGEEH